MEEASVSVIITSYNQEALLREAVESVINQTVCAHEILIADDHSTRDNSVATIREYEARYPGWIRGVFQSENLFIPRNRNAAMALVTGKYVTILDGDDHLLPQFIERHLAALAASPRAGCSYSNRYSLRGSSERREVRFSKPKPSGNIFAFVAAGEVGIVRTMVARYDLVTAAGFLDPRSRLHDGYLLSLRLAKVTEFVYVPEPLMEKREHTGGVTRATLPTERLASQGHAYHELVKLAADLPRSERREISRQWFWKLLTPRVLALTETGHRARAFLMLAGALMRSPTRRRIAIVLKLVKKVARGDITMERRN